MKETDIRPKHLFDEYLNLSSEDAVLLDKEQFDTSSKCLACNSKKIIKKLNKLGFTFVECSECSSLFCNPRPNKDQLDWFYVNSNSSKFWSNNFIPAVEQIRKEKIYKPKAKRIASIIKENNIQRSSVCDCGAGNGILLDELRALLPNVVLSAIEPNVSASKILNNKKYNVLNTTIEKSNEWAMNFDLVLSLEVFEHVQSPNAFLKGMFELIKPGGYCLITTLGYEGFDIQVLMENSKSISPPHHLNFFSVKGFKKIFSKVGFKNIQITTPGKLDVDIVLNNKNCPEFLIRFATRGDKALDDLQNLLSKWNFSSHVWILAQK